MESFPQPDIPIENKESSPELEISIEENYFDFVPEDFKEDPFKYFEEKGQNIKPGDTEYNEIGEIKEDPKAVKVFPEWTSSTGESIKTVGKKINSHKAQIGASGNPFHEYDTIQRVRSMGLPAPEPVLKTTRGAESLFVLKKAEGINWFEKNSIDWLDKGFSTLDLENLQKEAEEKMRELESRFTESGIIRRWKLKDMVFDIDFEHKSIRSITPTDWERTKIVEHQK